MENDRKYDKLTVLWHGANYQDNLLQSYRNFHLTTQSILTAIGVGISVAALSFDSFYKVISSVILFLAISGLALYLLLKMRRLIAARGEDVDYYHDQIIEFEKGMPKSERILTAFKIYQKFSRDKTNINEYFRSFELTEKILSELTERGKGHTRRVLDNNLFKGFMVVWICLYINIIVALVGGLLLK